MSKGGIQRATSQMTAHLAAEQAAKAAEAERLRTRSFDTRSQNAATYTHGKLAGEDEESTLGKSGSRRRFASREILG